MLVTKELWVIIDIIEYFFLLTIEVNGAPQLFGYKHSSEHLPLRSIEERNPYMFKTTQE